MARVYYPFQLFEEASKKERKDEMLGKIFVASQETTTPLEYALRREYERYQIEQEKQKLERDRRYMEEAREAFKRYIGDYPFHFERGTVVQSGETSEIFIIRAGEIRLHFNPMLGIRGFNVVRVCNECGNIFLDTNQRIDDLRQLAIEVHKSGAWYCHRCEG